MAVPDTTHSPVDGGRAAASHHTPTSTLLLLAGAAGAIIALSACSAPVALPTVPASAIATPASSSTPVPATPVATPPGSAATPSPATTALGSCHDLNAVVGRVSGASGGQRGTTVTLGNDFSLACALRGPVQLAVFDQAGTAIPTQATAAGGTVLLPPRHVALDPGAPQPGEATFQITWRTGDTQPGVCSSATRTAATLVVDIPPAADLTIALPSGREPIAPCGAITVGALRQAVPAAAGPSAMSVAVDTMQQSTGLTFSPSPCAASVAMCLTGGTVQTGTHAASVQFALYGGGGGVACFVYLHQDSQGWHLRDTVCTQNDGAPQVGASTPVVVSAGSCADLHDAPGHASPSISCPLAQLMVTIDQGPVYVAETDADTHLPDGTIWWHVTLPGGGSGWLAHDHLAARRL